MEIYVTLMNIYEAQIKGIYIRKISNSHVHKMGSRGASH